MEPTRTNPIIEFGRQAVWQKMAPVLVEALVPLVVSPEDVDWAAGLTIEQCDRLKRVFYEHLGHTDLADDGPFHDIAVVWGGEKAQFARLRRLVGEIGGDVALAVGGEGLVRTRSQNVAKRLKRLYDHFGTLEVYGLDTEGGVSIFTDSNTPGWWEMTVIGRKWVGALRRIG